MPLAWAPMAKSGTICASKLIRIVRGCNTLNKIGNHTFILINLINFQMNK